MGDNSKKKSVLQSQFGHMSMTTPRSEALNSSGEVCEGAGEQWSTPLTDDTMMDSYCNSSGRDSSSKI